MGIIDTHLHLIDLERLRYPWLDGVPALKRSFTLQEYRLQAAPLGISAMLHVEVDVAEADVEQEKRLVTAVGKGVIGAIVACRPERADFPAFLERMAADPRVRGFRRVLHTGAHDMARSERFIAHVRMIADHGRTFDICIRPQHLPLAAALAAACPDVQFVLDHCGMPDIKARALDPWRAYISALAALPNVACKISGVIAYGHPCNWTVGHLRPYVEHAISCFGWERVVWGSDWPVCTLTADLRRWVEATHEILSDAGTDERGLLFEHNARRLYGLSAELS